MSHRFTAAAGTVLLLALALSGCAGNSAGPSTDAAGGATPPGSSPAPTTSAPASAPASASPSTDPSAEPAADVVTTAGYGDLRIGRPVPAGTDLVEWKADLCGPGAGRWRPPTAKDIADQFIVQTENGARTGAVTEVLIYDETVQTKSGAHVGMSEAQLKKVLPDLRRVGSGGGGHLLGISDASGTVAFEIYGADPKVADIIVVPRGTEPTGVTATDSGAACNA